MLYVQKPIELLDCMDCDLTEVPFYRQYGSSVLYLDLQKNNITEITQKVLSVSPNLIPIDARGNHYVCGALKVSGIKVRSNCPSPTAIRHNIITSETANPYNTLIPIPSTTNTQLSFKSTTTLMSATKSQTLQPSSSRPEALSPSTAITSCIPLPTSKLTTANIVITPTYYPDSTSILYLSNSNATASSSSSSILKKPIIVAISQPKQTPILLISLSTNVCTIFIIGFIIKFKRYLHAAEEEEEQIFNQKEMVFPEHYAHCQPALLVQVRKYLQFRAFEHRCFFSC